MPNAYLRLKSQRPSLREYLLSTCFVVAACDMQNGAPSDSETDPKITLLPRTRLDSAIAGATQGFGARLLAAADDSLNQKNLALSPFSATMALGMALLGAEGETRAEMARTLGLPAASDSDLVAALRNLKASIEQGDPKIAATTANSAWLQKDFPILASWKKALKGMGAEVGGVDFPSPTTPAIINEWVNQETRKIIPKIIEDGEDLGSLAAMLINATYFKGAWSKAFEPTNSYAAAFQVKPGTEVQAKYLSASGCKGGFLRDSHFVAAALPFGGGGFEMVFLLPDEDYSLPAIIQSLASDPERLSRERFTDQTFAFSAPIFHVKSELDLIPALKALGMKSAFALDQADFSRISPEPLVISKVKQIADVRIDEQGAEAAAVTRVDIIKVSLPIGPELHANRPFLYLIRETGKQGLWLFAGAVRNPNL